MAGIFTVSYKTTMTYKYGCSDEEFHKMGPMQLLMWKAIQEAKENGLSEFDLGRTEWDNEGLLAFKDRWGAARSTILYLRHPAPKPQRRTQSGLRRFGDQVFALAPDCFLTTAGNILYRHFA